MTVAKAKILCIDDEPNVLAGLALNLRRDFEVLTATSGEQGLAILANDPEITAVMSDMRMPKMTGAAVLAKVRASRPHVTRLLLTGQADLASAISAVNDGQIFRFLTKPCDRDPLVAALTAAVEQHRLITAERDLVENTLRGAIAALVDVLALANPVAFGRSTRVRARATKIASAAKLPDVWQIEMAASLQSVGYIALPHATMDRVNAGHALSSEEQEMTARMPALTEQVLGKIPRLDKIREILRVANQPPSADATTPLALAGTVLRLANDAEILDTRGSTELAILEILQGRDCYPEVLVTAMNRLVSTKLPLIRVVELSVGKLRPGMVVFEDVQMANGNILVTRGYEISVSFLERVRNFPAGTIREPIRISVEA